jgi:hypothetical protein
MPGVSRRAHRGGPNDGVLFRRWQASRDPNICVMNVLDVASIVPIGIDRKRVSGDALVQGTGAKQALLNVKDVLFGNQPTIEFADAEAYRTAGNITYPAKATFVFVGEEANGGSFSIFWEFDPYYSASNGGAGSYINGFSNLRGIYHYTDYAEVTRTGINGAFVSVHSVDPTLSGTPGPNTIFTANGLDFNSNGGPGASAGAFRAARLQLCGRDSLNSQFSVGAWCALSIYSGLFDATSKARERAYWRAEYAI